jgi:phosphoribosyl 1,2-cyclic phosphate phosphodiesterase
LRVTFLGTGTSHGVPMIGCDCAVCRSDDPHNVRTRSSVLIEIDGVSLLIDTPPDLRGQVLRENVRRIDAILFTHAHADHLFGLDDVRRFNDLSGAVMPCYGLDETLRTIRRVFEYVFVPTQVGGGKPELELMPVNAPFAVNGVTITPVQVLHGKLNVLGYRIGDFAYVTDVSAIPDASLELLTGLDVLVLGVLRPQPHETHFSVDEGLAVVETLQPKSAYFTHIAHKLDHQTTNAALPPNVRLAYDGLQITL